MRTSSVLRRPRPSSAPFSPSFVMSLVLLLLFAAVVAVVGDGGNAPSGIPNLPLEEDANKLSVGGLSYRTEVRTRTSATRRSACALGRRAWPDNVQMGKDIILLLGQHFLRLANVWSALDTPSTVYFARSRIACRAVAAFIATKRDQARWSSGELDISV